MDPRLIPQVQHRTIFSNGRWERMPLCEKMGNIGSEIARARHGKDKDQEKSMLQALWRGLELLDFTIDCTPGPRRQELCRVRELFCDYLIGDNLYRITGEQLQQYFDDFALAYQWNRHPSQGPAQ